MGLLVPERYFSRLSHVGIARDLHARGYSHVLLDIDNTILRRDTHEIPREEHAWLARARDAGISVCLLSNNWHESVHSLARELELPLVAKACKPLPHGYILAMRKLGATRKDTVMIGDQLSTDVVGAHLVGMAAYLLQPLVEQDLAHTKLVRIAERAIIGNRQPEPAPAACIGSADASAPSAKEVV